MHEILTPIFGGLAATLGWLLWHARREIGTLREAATSRMLASNSPRIPRPSLDRSLSAGRLGQSKHPPRLKH